MIISVGQNVMTKYGLQKITKIELCEKVGDKYGIEIKEIYTDLVDRCVFDLDNGHFAYGDQIDFVNV
tara:strand:+ start:917 stop:1117 length:201 start_codon:yes stop_codon:yes gene_type:complete